MKKKAVGEVFTGVRSTVTGLLLSVFVTLVLTMLFGITDIKNVGAVSVDYIGIILFAAIFPISFIKIKGKKMKPILLVILSAALGVLCYGLCDYFGVAL